MLFSNQTRASEDERRSPLVVHSETKCRRHRGNKRFGKMLHDDRNERSVDMTSAFKRLESVALLQAHKFQGPTPLQGR